eukprot:g14887.t1
MPTINFGARSQRSQATPATPGHHLSRQLGLLDRSDDLLADETPRRAARPIWSPNGLDLDLDLDEDGDFLAVAAPERNNNGYGRPRLDDARVIEIGAAIKLIATWVDAVELMEDASSSLIDFERTAAAAAAVANGDDVDAEQPAVAGKGVGKGGHLRSEVPTKGAIIKAWKRSSTANGRAKVDARHAPPEQIQQTIVELVTKRHTIFDYDLNPDLPMPLLDAGEVEQGGEIVCEPDPEFEKEVARQKLVDVKASFGSSNDWQRFGELEGYKERFKCLEWLMGCSTATATKKVALLQRFLGVMHVMTQKTRFRLLTEEEQLALPGDDDELVRIWQGPYSGEVVGEEGVKRRKLLRIGNDKSRENQKIELEELTKWTARVQGAFRKAASRAETKAVRYYKLETLLKLETALDIDICSRGRRYIPTRMALLDAEGSADGGEDLAQWQNANPEHVPHNHVLVSAARKSQTRPFIVIRLGPDATNMKKKKQLALEVVVIRANDDYSISFVPVTPPSKEHGGGSANLLQDLCVMIADALPLAGATVSEFISDPIALLLIASDCGSDVLKFIRTFRKLCTAARLERYLRLGLLPEVQDEEVMQAFFGDLGVGNADMDVDDADETTVPMAGLPVEVYCMQMICMNHQYHLLDGELIDGMLDQYPEFLKQVRHVVKAYDYWGEKIKGRGVRKFAEHRWQTLKNTFEDLLKNRPYVITEINKVCAKSRSDAELQATAAGAQAALRDTNFWENVRSLRRVLDVTDELAREAKQDASEVFSNTRFEEMKRHKPCRENDLLLICERYLESQGDASSVGLALIIKMIMRIPDRQKQYWTWPLQFNRFSSSCIQERRRAADLLLLTVPQKRDPFLQKLCDTFADELEAMSEQQPGERMPLPLFKWLAPVFIGNSGTAVVVEGMHSQTNNHQKFAPNLGSKKAGELLVIDRERTLEWEQWRPLAEEWSNRHDKRRKKGKLAAAAREALQTAIERSMGLARVVDGDAPAAAGGGADAANQDQHQVVGVDSDDEHEQADGEDEGDFLHKVLERALFLQDKHAARPELTREPPEIGGPVENLGVLTVPHGLQMENGCPQIKKRFGGDATIMAQDGYADLLCLLQKRPPPPTAPKRRAQAKAAAAAAKAAPAPARGAAAANAIVAVEEEVLTDTIYLCYYRAANKGYLLPVREVVATPETIGRPVRQTDKVYLVPFADQKTISHWATRPAETATGRMFRYRRNDATRFVWSRKHKCLACIADTRQWESQEVPRKDLLLPRKKKEYEEDAVARRGGEHSGRVFREYEWKSVNMQIAVPELVLSPELRELYANKKVYVIFRPEEAKWWALLGVKSRYKQQNGEPIMWKDGKSYSDTIHGRQLDQDSIQQSRRVVMNKDPTAGGEKRMDDATLNLTGEHPANSLRLYSNMKKVVVSLESGTFANPHRIAAIRSKGQLLILSGSHRIQALKEYRKINGNACQEVRMTYITISEEMMQHPLLLARYVRTKNEGQTGLRTTLAEKVFDVFPRLEKEFKLFTAEQGNKNADKHKYFKTRCDSTGPAYEMKEFAYAFNNWGDTDKSWTQYTALLGDPVDEDRYAMLFKTLFRKLRIEYLGVTCRCVFLCAFFQLFCGSNRKEGEDLPKGLGTSLYESVALSMALLDIVKQNYRQEEPTLSKYHKNLIHLSAETCRNCMSGRVCEGLGVDLDTIEHNEQLVTATNPADAALEYAHEWLFSKAQNQKKLAIQRRLNKISAKLASDHHTFGDCGCDGAFTCIKKGGALSASIALGKGVRVILEVNESSPWKKMHGAKGVVVCKVECPEVVQCQNLRAIESQRYIKEKSLMKKSHENKKYAALKANTGKLKAAKKTTGKNEEAPVDDRATILAELDDEYEKTLKAAKEKHETRETELTERETAARTLDAFEVTLDDLAGVEGVNNPVVEAVQLNVDYSWYKVEDETPLDEEVILKKDQLEKMKVLPIRLPISVEVPEWYGDYELWPNIDIAFKPAAGYKLESLYLCPSETRLDYCGTVIKFKSPTAPHKHPDEKKKLCLECEQKNKAKAKASAKAKCASAAGGGKLNARQNELKQALAAFSANEQLKKAGHTVEFEEKPDKKQDKRTKKEKDTATGLEQKAFIEAAEKAEYELELLKLAHLKPSSSSSSSSTNTGGGSSSSASAVVPPKKIEKINMPQGEEGMFTIKTDPVLSGIVQEHNLKRARIDLVKGAGLLDSPHRSPGAKRSRSVSIDSKADEGEDADEVLRNFFAD